jgi:NAD(P)-dependent dehydrogenase (short-subunit alcohol dehydrogenase family)
MKSTVTLRGATALVTGAGSGIGRATSIALAREGTNVLAVDIDETNAKTTAAACADHGVDATAYQCDVADRAAVVALAERVGREHGALDVLVNNAGVGMSGRFLDMTMDDWDWIRSINLDGVLNGCHAFVPAMIARRKGHVVNVSSGLGYIPSAMTPAYSTTKAAVLMFSRSVRADWARERVGVSAICPGVINTPIIDATRFAGALDVPKARAMAKRGFSRGHSPDLVAKAIVRAIKRNEAVVPVGFESTLGWYLSRYLPQSISQVVGRPLPRGVDKFLGR